jgi:hypothetical protein
LQSGFNDVSDILYSYYYSNPSGSTYYNSGRSLLVILVVTHSIVVTAGTTCSRAVHARTPANCSTPGNGYSKYTSPAGKGGWVDMEGMRFYWDQSQAQ